MKKRLLLMWRWSLVSAALIALFWTVWYLVKGCVPESSLITSVHVWSINLSFSVSRWTDVLIGPMWSIILVYLLTRKGVDSQKFIFGMLICTLYGIVISIMYIFHHDDNYHNMIAIGIGIMAFRAFSSRYELLVSGLSLGLGIALVAGIGYGLLFDITFIIIFGIYVAALSVLMVISKWLFSPVMWKKFGNWLIAKDKEI